MCRLAQGRYACSPTHPHPTGVLRILGLDPSHLLSLGTEVFCGMALLSPKTICLHGTLSSVLPALFLAPAPSEGFGRTEKVRQRGGGEVGWGGGEVLSQMCAHLLPIKI